MIALTKCVLVLCAVVAASGFNLGPTDVVFHLYTRNNPSLSDPMLPTVDSIANSNYLSLARATVITIHNFDEDVSGNFNAFLIRDHLVCQDVNLIAVDWSAGATSGMYTEGLGNAPQVGRVIADFINTLITPFGYDASLVRIVGHGLGGHIAGIAARNVIQPIPHVIALDPSFVGWTFHPDRLGTDAATLVEVLYATAGSLSYDLPLGHLNFYPNGGSHQNGCGNDVNCSTMLSYIFYAESLLADCNDGNRFIGTKCESYEEAVANSCSGDRDVAFGGTAVKTGESGIYSFTTNFGSPFAQG